MSVLIDISGQRFGRLLVVRRVASDKLGKATWMCLCDCGKEQISLGANLRNGNTISCGCSRIKHDHAVNGSQNKEYEAWASMVKRCTNPNNRYYHLYGGRGIVVCNRWRQFINFLFDMGIAPNKHDSLERIDNNGPYNKTNCCWTTSRKQARNTRKNRLLTHNGRTQCLSAWSEETGVHRATIVSRIARGWSTKKALMSLIGDRKDG